MGYVSRLLEWRAHPSSGSTEWGRIFDAGMQTASGVNLSVEGSLTLPSVFACVRVISETVASLPLLTYRRQGRGKSRAGDHILYKLLKEQPNPEQTSFEWREMMISHVTTWGNGYSEIVWSRRGQPVALWPLRPDRMTVERKNGELLYHYRRNNGQPDTFPAYRVHHIRGLSGDGLTGYSPVRLAMQAIGLGLATEEFGARFFSNGARPGLVIKHPGVLKKEAHDRLRSSWNGDHQGLSNAHRVKILEEGAGIEKIGVPPEEAQFLETRRFQALEIARMYRVPPHKIGLLENATFSNIEHQAIEFVVDTIRPWLVRHEQAMRRDLLVGQEEHDTLLIEYLVDGLLRGDTLSRYQAYAIARQWGWQSANDIRQMENMDPIQGGDAYLTPLNMVSASEPAKGKRWSEMLGLRQVYEDATRRLVRREAADLRRGIDKYLRKQGLDDFENWADEFYRSLTPVIREILTPAAFLHCDLVAGERKLVEAQLAQWAGAYVLAARQALSAGLRDTDLPDMDVYCARIEAGYVGVAAQLMEEVERYANGA